MLQKKAHITMFLLLFIFAFSSLFSAQFRVDSFARMGNDLRAIKESVKDINGDATALIKVRTDIDFLQFESALYPAKVENKIGEYYIFLSEGDRKISFLKEGYKRYDYYFPEKIKSGVVYYLDLAASEINSYPEKFAVTIQTEPQGARIYLDGRYLAKTEQLEVAAGEHILRIILSGHKMVEKKITVSAVRTFFKYKLEEQQDALVFINSKPEGALVYIDDVKIGTTPVSSFYPAGKFKINISKEMFEPVREYIDIGNPSTSKTYLLKDNRALLTINTYRNAAVFLNGVKIHKLKNIKVEPRICSLKITLNDKIILKKRVIIKKNERRVLDLFPELEKGAVQISVFPENATIELLKENRQVYEAENSAVLKDIPAGTYNLKIFQKGYRSHFSEIEVKNGKLFQQIVRLEKGSDIGGEFVYLESGYFMMGNSSGGSDEAPVHKVKVRSLFVGKYEVTQAEWKAVMDSNPSSFDGGWFGNNDDHPVENISWYDAVLFCNKRSEIEGYTPCYTILGDNVTCDFNTDGYRLPAEVEWEYAAGGGNRSSVHLLPGNRNIADVAWFNDNSGDETHPVGTRSANELGLYDMSGNVWEWCWDWYEPDYYQYSPAVYPAGPVAGRGKVIRGGSWNVVEHYLRISDRSYDYPDYHGFDRGFRLFRTAK